MSNEDTWWRLWTWTGVHSELKDSPWEDEDVENASQTPGGEDVSEVAQALKQAYGHLNGDADTVLAAIGAMVLLGHDRSFSAPEFLALVQGFQVHYDTVEEPLQDFLDEHYGELRLEWLNDKGRAELDSQVRRESEVWVTKEALEDTGMWSDGELSGAYVFTRPGHTA